MPHRVIAFTVLIALVLSTALTTNSQTTPQPPGVDDKKIIIGTSIPTSDPLAELGQAAKSVLEAAFAEVNGSGGIYGRQLELRIVSNGDAATADVFALAGPFIAGSEKQVLPLLAKYDVPTIGPITLFTKIDPPNNRDVFYLLSGLGEQARGLISFVASKPGVKGSMMPIIYTANEVNSNTLEGAQQESRKAAINVQLYEYQAGKFDAVSMSKQFAATKPPSVFFLGSSSDLLSFMREAEKLSWYPQILLRGASTEPAIFDAPIGFDQKVFVTFPTAPSDFTAQGSSEYRALADKYHLPPKHIAAQAHQYATTKILIEGLKRAGKDLTRARLIAALESLRDFQT